MLDEESKQLFKIHLDYTVTKAKSSYLPPLQPRLDRLVLPVKMVHVRDEILDDVHVRQGIYLQCLAHIGVNLAGSSSSEKSTRRGDPFYLMQAKVLQPSIFMAQEPQMPSRQDLLKVRVGSTSFLILSRASSTMGPHLAKSTSYSLMYGCCFGWSGSHR